MYCLRKEWWTKHRPNSTELIDKAKSLKRQNNGQLNKNLRLGAVKKGIIKMMNWEEVRKMGRYRSLQSIMLAEALKGITDNQTITADKSSWPDTMSGISPELQDSDLSQISRTNNHINWGERTGRKPLNWARKRNTTGLLWWWCQCSTCRTGGLMWPSRITWYNRINTAVNIMVDAKEQSHKITHETVRNIVKIIFSFF